MCLTFWINILYIVHLCTRNAVECLFPSRIFCVMSVFLFQTLRRAWQEGNFVYLICCMFVRNTITYCNCVPVGCGNLDCPGPNPQLLSVCECVFSICVNPQYSGSLWGGVSTLLQPPHEWISIHLANKSLLCLRTQIPPKRIWIQPQASISNPLPLI